MLVFWIGGPIAGRVVGEMSRRSTVVPPADQVAIPSTAPSSLAGEAVDVSALRENSSWRGVVSSAASESTVSFGAVYGAYPPSSSPTLKTFLVVGAKPIGGTGDLTAQASQMIDSFTAEAAKMRGAATTSLPLRPSILGGSIVCVSLKAPVGMAGECFWENPAVSVQVVTYSTNLVRVSSLTAQVVEELHDHVGSGFGSEG